MKKLLALVLALVMTLSLCTVTNAAFPDAADVDYKEAVDVMSAVGVFKGDEKGNFNPDATLTRETAAKLIAYLDLGEKVAEALPSVKVFSDVEANRWSAKYIAYCADAGYIAGVGDGTFNPTGELTGYAFGKLLLCVLGYDANIEQFTGANWSIAVAKYMQASGINNDVDKAGSAVLTREEAAQYCLNALKANCVEYDDKGTQISINGATIATGASAAKPVTTGYSAAVMTAITDEDTDTLQLGEKLYKGDLVLDKTDKADDFERPATVWSYDGEPIGDYSTDATYTFEGKVTGKAMYSKVGKTVATTPYTWKVYVDGAAGGFAQSDVNSTNADALADCVAGSVTEVYVDTSAKTVTVCIINTYVAEVATVVSAEDVKDDEKPYITLNDLSASGPATTEKFETVGFEEDDVVLYTYADSKIQSVKLAEEVTGSVSKVKADTNFVVNGTTYAYSAQFVDTKVSTVSSDETVFYVDEQGNCIHIGSVAASTDYAYVIAKDKTSKFDSTTYYAKLLLADATVVEVETKNDATSNVGYVVSYTVNNKGQYVLTNKSAAAIAADTTLDIDKGVAKMKVGGSSVYANAKTLFLVSDGASTPSYKAYTGIANMPSMTGKTATETVAWVEGTTAKVVYITTADTSTATASDLIFVVGDASAKLIKVDGANYYEFDAVVDGKVTKLEIAEGSDAYDEVKTAGVKTFASYNTDSNNYVTEFVAVSGLTVTSGTKTEKAANGNVGLAGEFYAYTDDTLVVKYDGDELTIAKVSAVKTDANDGVTVVTNTSSGKLVAAFITVVD